MKKYSIVCYLEGESRDRVRKTQEQLFELTGSRACLDSWSPHITIGDGPIVSENELENLEQEIKNLAVVQGSFPLILEGFGGRTDKKSSDGEITTPYVLWVNIVAKDTFDNFLRKTDIITDKYTKWYTKPESYIPHVTIAFRDLSKEGYEKGLEYLKNLDFKDAITISHIALVENFPDRDVEYKRFYLK